MSPLPLSSPTVVRLVSYTTEATNRFHSRAWSAQGFGAAQHVVRYRILQDRSRGRLGADVKVMRG